MFHFVRRGCLSTSRHLFVLFAHRFRDTILLLVLVPTPSLLYRYRFLPLLHTLCPSLLVFAFAYF